MIKPSDSMPILGSPTSRFRYFHARVFEETAKSWGVGWELADWSLLKRELSVRDFRLHVG